MTLSKKQRQEVAAMIARAFTVTGAGVDSEEIEAAAQEQLELKELHYVRQIMIITDLTGDRDLLPDCPTVTRVRIWGSLDGESQYREFYFRPGCPAYLDELKRIQNHPHLFQSVHVRFCKEPGDGRQYIVASRRSWAGLSSVPPQLGGAA